MRCDSGHENPPGLKFCGECGQNLIPASERAAEVPPPLSDTNARGLGRSDHTEGQGIWQGSAGELNAPPVNAPSSNTSARGWIITAILVAGIIGAGVLYFVLSGGSDSPSEIEEAANTCDVSGNVGDDGSSISFDTEGEEDSTGDSYADVACVLLALDVPDRVTERMDQTRALDGTLDAAWGDYEAFWNYHPDSGMNLTVYEAE